MDIGCRWTRICCGTSDVRSSLSCPVGCYRKSQTKAGTDSTWGKEGVGEGGLINGVKQYKGLVLRLRLRTRTDR
jgi:hypothetical protein